MGVVANRHSQPSSTGVHPELVANFGLFRRPQTELDLADDVAAREPLVGRLDLLPTEVRRVAISPFLLVWVTPGAGGAALTQKTVDADGEEFGTWGGRVDSVSLRGLVGWTKHLNGDETFYGLVPDGNQEVTLNLLDREPIQLPVIENVFIGRSNGPAYSLDFVDGRGHPDRRRWREHR